MLGTIARTTEQQACGRVALLVVGHNLAVRVARDDGHATPDEREAAQVFGRCIRARLRRNLDLLDDIPTVASRATASAVSDYLAERDREAKSRGARRTTLAEPVEAWNFCRLLR